MHLIGPTPVPCLADQCADAGWPFGFYSFADASPSNEYFNPAIVEWHERDWLIVRRRRGAPGTPGQNTLEAWLLKNNRPSRRVPLVIPGAAANESAEDPRCFVRGKALIVSFCQFVPGEGFAHQAMTGVQADGAILRVEQPIHVKFGCNGDSRSTNTGHEKNWTAFTHEGRIHISYSLANGAHIVVKTEMAKAVKVTYGRAPIWPHGTLRGGTCPTLGPEGLFWTFFHSSNHWYCGKRRYYMGALAFEPKPPFHVVRMTAKPLLVASELDFRNQWAPPCVWPAGCVIRDGSWLVSLGINDNACGFVQISHDSIERTTYVTA